MQQTSDAAFDVFCKVARDRCEVSVAILGMNLIEEKKLLLSVANGGGFDHASVPRPEGLEFLAHNQE